MTDVNDEHHEALILDVADDAIVSDAVPPIEAERVALERSTEFARVFMRGQTIFQVQDDARGVSDEIRCIWPG